jgi:hypothetical protein
VDEHDPIKTGTNLLNGTVGVTKSTEITVAMAMQNAQIPNMKTLKFVDKLNLTGLMVNL